jgi:hypothetical protein
MSPTAGRPLAGGDPCRMGGVGTAPRPVGPGRRFSGIALYVAPGPGPHA